MRTQVFPNHEPRTQRGCAAWHTLMPLVAHSFADDGSFDPVHEPVVVCLVIRTGRGWQGGCYCVAAWSLQGESDEWRC